MKAMFQACINLEEIPDISGWNTSNVKDMSYMFYECTELRNKPDLSRWNRDDINMENMF